MTNLDRIQIGEYDYNLLPHIMFAPFDGLILRVENHFYDNGVYHHSEAQSFLEERIKIESNFYVIPKEDRNKVLEYASEECRLKWNSCNFTLFYDILSEAAAEYAVVKRS